MCRIMADAAEFTQSLKAAQNYILKDGDKNNALNYLLLKQVPKMKKLAVIACDGHGYFERRVSIARESGSKGVFRPVCVFWPDAQTLYKLIQGRTNGSIALEGIKTANGNSVLKIMQQNGAVAEINMADDLQLPDYAGMCAKAEKAKKKACSISDVHVPVHEILRAGKSLPAKAGCSASMYAVDSSMAVLEYSNDATDIKIIFTFAKPAAEAA